MKNIHQLVKLGRRIPNRIRVWNQRKSKAKTPAQARFCVEQIQLCEQNGRWLAGELFRRNIHGIGVRDTETPAVKSKRLFFERLIAAIDRRNAAI